MDARLSYQTQPASAVFRNLNIVEARISFSSSGGENQAIKQSLLRRLHIWSSR